MVRRTDSIAFLTRSFSINPCRSRLCTRSEFVAPEARHAILDIDLTGGLLVKLRKSLESDNVMAVMSTTRKMKRFVEVVMGQM